MMKGLVLTVFSGWGCNAGGTLWCPGRGAI